MALLALHHCMLSFQSKAGTLVLEFEIEPQRRPAFGRVAITARDFDFAVRLVCSGNLCRCRRARQENKQPQPD